MRVLVAGSGGQLGRALQASVPADVTLFAPPETNFDIADSDMVQRVVTQLHLDVIINAAAYTAVDQAESNVATARSINVNAVGTLATAARLAGAAFAHVSTDFVFDGTAHRPYLPDATPNPLSVYGRTKLDGEIAAVEFHGDPLIVRTAWVYAAQGKNFVATMLRLMRERSELRIVADQIGTPTHVPTLARALWKLVGGNHTGLYHVTDAGVASWYDFAVAIHAEALSAGLLTSAVTIIPVRSEDYPTPAVRPAYGVLDKTETWAITGPARHWHTELRDCIATIRDSV